MEKRKEQRKIIVIDEKKCDGCGLCATACHEGAIAVIDGKARLVSESYCDGLGDCIGECPQGAISFETREAESYDEEAVRRRASRDPLPCGCPGTATRTLGCPGTASRELERAQAEATGSLPSGSSAAARPSRLRNWPTQLRLVPLNAPYLKGADVVLASDCSPFAFAPFHETFLGEGKVLLNACPKLDDSEAYRAKLAQMIETAGLASIHVVRMEVPCCGGLARLVEEAVSEARRPLKVRVTTLSVEGEILSDETVRHHFS